MSTINGTNYQKQFINEPSEAAGIGEYNGKQRVCIDHFSGAVAADVVNFGKLPPNAFILGFGNVGAGTAPTYSLAVGDKLSASTVVTCTLDADTAAAGKIWVEYSLD